MHKGHCGSGNVLDFSRRSYCGHVMHRICRRGPSVWQNLVTRMLTSMEIVRPRKHCVKARTVGQRKPAIGKRCLHSKPSSFRFLVMSSVSEEGFSFFDVNNFTEQYETFIKTHHHRTAIVVLVQLCRREIIGTNRRYSFRLPPRMIWTFLRITLAQANIRQKNRVSGASV